MDSQPWVPRRPPNVTQAELSQGLLPIRGFVLAQALYSAIRLGVLEAIANRPSVDMGELAVSLELDYSRLIGLFRFLANEEIVGIKGNAISLSDRGRLMLKLEPWYTLLVGGYSQTLAGIEYLLRDGKAYGARDTRAIGQGSCGISEHDALPMVIALLERLPEKPSRLVDIGCGDGRVLLSLSLSISNVIAVGIDPEPSSIEHANRLAVALNIDNRVQFLVGDSDSLEEIEIGQGDGVVVFSAAFLLQEILEQSGRQKIVEMLEMTAMKYPGCYWVIVEVDQQIDSSAIKSSDLGLSYYNPYYLLHELTRQRLEPSQFWEDLFHEAGFETIAIEHPDPHYDALKLKKAYLIASGSCSLPHDGIEQSNVKEAD